MRMEMSKIGKVCLFLEATPPQGLVVTVPFAAHHKHGRLVSISGVTPRSDAMFARSVQLRQMSGVKDPK